LICESPLRGTAKGDSVAGQSSGLAPLRAYEANHICWCVASLLGEALASYHCGCPSPLAARISGDCRFGPFLFREV